MLTQFVSVCRIHVSNQLMKMRWWRNDSQRIIELHCFIAPWQRSLCALFSTANFTTVPVRTLLQQQIDFFLLNCIAVVPVTAADILPTAIHPDKATATQPDRHGALLRPRRVERSHASSFFQACAPQLFPKTNKLLIITLLCHGMLSGASSTTLRHLHGRPWPWPPPSPPMDLLLHTSAQLEATPCAITSINLQPASITNSDPSASSKCPTEKSSWIDLGRLSSVPPC